MCFLIYNIYFFFFLLCMILNKKSNLNYKHFEFVTRVLRKNRKKGILDGEIVLLIYGTLRPEISVSGSVCDWFCTQPENTHTHTHTHTHTLYPLCYSLAVIHKMGSVFKMAAGLSLTHTHTHTHTHTKMRYQNSFMSQWCLCRPQWELQHNHSTSVLH